MVNDLEEDVKEKYKHRKSEYKINTNLSFGFIKQEIIRIFLVEDTSLIEEELKRLFLKNVVPIRSGRKYKRDLGKHGNKKNHPFSKI